MIYTKEQLPVVEADKGLSSDQLDNKYNPDGDGEHPVVTRALWRERVANQDTISGYWTWVAHEIAILTSLLYIPAPMLPEDIVTFLNRWASTATATPHLTALSTERQAAINTLLVQRVVKGFQSQEVVGDIDTSLDSIAWIELKKYSEQLTSA